MLMGDTFDWKFQNSWSLLLFIGTKHAQRIVDLSKSPCFEPLLPLISIIAVTDILEERRVDVRGDIEIVVIL